MKKALFLIILLATAGIIIYKTVWANTNISSTKNIAYSSLNRFNFTTPVSFAFGKPALETTSIMDAAIQENQNLGEYVGSLDELNIIAVDKEVVIIFIPGSGNDLIDDNTKDAILKFQQSLKKNRNDAGLYTLWCNSNEYSDIAKYVRLPAIIVARKDKGTITMPCININEYILYQAYQKAKVKGRCEYYTPNCC
jgi:hypothetical protein